MIKTKQKTAAKPKKFSWKMNVNELPVDRAVGSFDPDAYQKVAAVKKPKWEDRNPIDLKEVRAKLRKIDKEN